MGFSPRSLIQSPSPGTNCRLEEGSVCLWWWGIFCLGFCALSGAVWWDFAWSWFAEVHLSALVGVLPHVCDMSFSFLFYWVSRAGGYDRLLGLPATFSLQPHGAPLWLTHVPAPKPLHCSSLPVFLFVFVF